MSKATSGRGGRRAAASPRAPSVNRNGSIDAVGPPRRRRAAKRPAPPPPEPPIEVRLARHGDLAHVGRIGGLIREAHEAGATIAIRNDRYLTDAIRDRRAVVVMRAGALVGFATAHPWDSGKFVSHSAMVIAPELRGRGLSRRMKQELIALSRQRWPDAAILSLTLSAQVEQLNKSVGFEAVPYCDLTKDPEFWKGCESCIHFPHLKRNQQQDCHCWAGLLVPPGSKRDKVVPRDAFGHPSAGHG